MNSSMAGVAVAVSGLLAAGLAPAGNVTVANTALGETAKGKAAVKFDLAWEKSWRDSVNHDACWVFAKYSVDSGATWRHASLAASGTNPDGFDGGKGVKLDVIVPADKKGAFVQRSAAGSGAVSNAGLTLGWDIGADKVSNVKDVRVKVFALEMVYIPEGSYYLGSGGGEVSHFFLSDGTAQTTKPYPVLSETNPITIGPTNGNLYYAGSEYGGDQKGTLPPAYPKGYAAFYLMKMELSQRQYCDFLNTLAAQQQTNRQAAALYFNSFRHFIKMTGGSPAVFGCDANNNAGATTNADFAHLNEADDGEWVAYNYVSWADGAAYADWAALRPFTELEFEKACRGPLAPVTNEFAWGNAVQELPVTSELLNANTARETPNRGSCNLEACSPDGPYRCGSYADSRSGRTNTAAGYYGALDLSGNVWERSVTAGHPTGRAFTGQHGDGELTALGNANVPNWPGLVAGEVTVAIGAGFRGGNWTRGEAFARVSDRGRGARPGHVRDYGYGWRAARSAP